MFASFDALPTYNGVVGILVLSGIGALIWMSLRELAMKRLFEDTPQGTKNDYPKIEDLQLSHQWQNEALLSESSSTPASASPSQHYNWKRFWDLFSTKRELSAEEKVELAELKTKLHEIHKALETEEKRRATELRRLIQERLSELKISDDHRDYIVLRDDFKRGSDKERTYVRLHRNFLYRTYDNRCAKCGDDSNGLDIDHFFFSKNEGGCFEMLRRDGFRVNNAIPLCESCNRSKSDRSYKHFFSEQELILTMEKNAKMNDRLNQTKLSNWTGGSRSKANQQPRI